jgi:hypothetical protein
MHGVQLLSMLVCHATVYNFSVLDVGARLLELIWKVQSYGSLFLRCRW